MRDPRAELVRIDSHGQAHAIGSVASQRLRGHQGAYRLLPTPRHVVFMRYTGEDGERDASDGAVVRLAGEITAPGALCDIVALLAQTGWRGDLAGQAHHRAVARVALAVFAGVAHEDDVPCLLYTSPSPRDS